MYGSCSSLMRYAGSNRFAATSEAAWRSSSKVSRLCSSNRGRLVSSSTFSQSCSMKSRAGSNLRWRTVLPVIMPCSLRDARLSSLSPTGAVSFFARAFLWTSSGPSANRSVRMPANMLASGKSCDSPPAPCTWIALSRIHWTVAGVAILIAWISVCAPLLPTVSISQAVLSTSRRSCSSAHPGLGDPVPDHALLGERLAERDPSLGALAHQLDGAFGDADRAHAVVDAARPEPGLGDARSRRPRSPIRLATGTRTSVNRISAWPPCSWSS